MWYNVYNLVNQCLLFMSKSFPYLESNTQSWLPYPNALAYSFVYKVQLKLILVYCTCFIKMVLVFTVSAERVPFKVLSHTLSHTHTADIHTTAPWSPHGSTSTRCEGLTPIIRQLLGDRVVDLFFDSFEKKKAWGERIWPLQC